MYVCMYIYIYVYNVPNGSFAAVRVYHAMYMFIYS